MITKKILLCLCALFVLSGCEEPIQRMEATEFGVVFRNLPPFLGGGIGKSTVAPGGIVFLFPWDSIIRVNTASQDVPLGENATEEQQAFQDFVFTRALDGNEVALKMTIRYQIDSDSKALGKLVQEVGRSDAEVRGLVIALARAEIRAQMNALTTANFIDEKHRYEAVNKVRESLSDRLTPYGIKVLATILERFEFARLLPDGKVDTEYQEKLNETQRKREETEREKLRIDTVKAEGQQKLNQAQAQVNRRVQDAIGRKGQATSRGIAYLEAKTNDAKAILGKGKAEVEGIVERINALAGPGGQAILKLEIAKRLKDANPHFVVLNGAKTGTSLEVNKVDVNQLLQQVGVLEGLKKEDKTEPVAQEADHTTPGPIEKGN